MFSSLRSLWQDRLLRGIVKNSSYLFSSSSVAAVLSMIQGIFAARMLGTVSLGILAVIMANVSSANRLVSFRMSELVVKYFSQYIADDNREQAGAIIKGAGLVEGLMSWAAFGLLALFAPLAARYIVKDPSTAYLFVLYGLYLLFQSFYETSMGVLQSTHYFSRLALINLIQSVITAVLIFIAFLLKGGLFEVALAYLVGKSVAGVLIAFVAFRQVNRVVGPGWWRVSLKRLPPLKELARFGLSTNLHATINLLVRDNEVTLISFLRSPAEAGYYRIAMSVINLIMTPIDPFIAPTYAQITDSLSKKLYGLTRSLLKRVSLISGAWTISTGLVLILFGWWIIPTLYGAEFAPSYPALAILLAGYGLANILHWNRPLLLALGMPDYPVKTAAGFGLLKTLATFLLVPAFGFLAEAAILSSFFVTSVGTNVWRGLAEIRIRAADEKRLRSLGQANSEAGSQTP